MDWTPSPPIILCLAIAVGLLGNSGNRDRLAESVVSTNPSPYQLLTQVASYIRGERQTNKISPEAIKLGERKCLPKL